MPAAKTSGFPLCRARAGAWEEIGIALFVMARLDPAIPRTIEFTAFFSG
jgi:hypothetical protein